MSQDKKPTLLTPSSTQTPPPAATPPVVTPLAIPQGGGSKQWIIMAVLAGLIGIGAWAVVGLKDKKEGEAAAATTDDQSAPASSTKKRDFEKTEERPLKKEMQKVRVDKMEDFKNHIKEWVVFEGQVDKGNRDGELTFKGSSRLKGQLIRGSAAHITGRHVRLIAWVKNQDNLQIDGLEDIEMVEPVDLLPKKDVYTVNDFKQLNSLEGDKIKFHGEVEKVRTSGSGKTLYIVFKCADGEIYGSGRIDKLEDGITEESLAELVGKQISIEGKVDRVKLSEGHRVTIDFEKKDDYAIIR